MSRHAATVYFGVCEICGKQSPFKASDEKVKVWEKGHYSRKHGVMAPKSKKVTLTTLEPQKIQEGGPH